MNKLKKMVKSSFLFENNQENRFAFKFSCTNAKKNLIDLIKNGKNIKKKKEEMKENLVSSENKEITEKECLSSTTRNKEKARKPDNCFRKYCYCCFPWKKNSVISSGEESSKLMESTVSESKRETN